MILLTDAMALIKNNVSHNSGYKGDVMIQRQQIQNRENFTDEERRDVAAKSDGYCAHCGKRIEFGGKATVDHFVPLSKGGVNAAFNRVMLCHNCNQEKGNLIIPPDGYLNYLHDEDLKKLIDYYYDSYIRAFDYFDTQHTFAADRMYVHCFNLDKNTPVRIKQTKHKKYYHSPGFEAMIQRVESEEDKKLIKEFWSQYLQKHKIIGHIYDIDFYLASGNVYYFAQADGIKMIFAMVLSQLAYNAAGLQIFVHSMYSRDLYMVLAHKSIELFAGMFMDERDFITSPVAVTTFKEDGIKLVMALKHYRPHSTANEYVSSYFLAKLSDKKVDIDDETMKASSLILRYLPDEQVLDSFIQEHEGSEYLKELVYQDMFFVPPTYAQTSSSENV